MRDIDKKEIIWQRKINIERIIFGIMNNTPDPLLLRDPADSERLRIPGVEARSGSTASAEVAASSGKGVAFFSEDKKKNLVKNVW